jgi:hypothetical protein
MAHFKQFAFKQFGYFDFRDSQLRQGTPHDFDSCVKIAFLNAGGHAVVDFKEYKLEQDAIFFISAGQYYEFSEECSGTLLYYNRDFYCVALHDKEVACDGILFHNVYEIPAIFYAFCHVGTHAKDYPRN